MIGCVVAAALIRILCRDVAEVGDAVVVPTVDDDVTAPEVVVR